MGRIALEGHSSIGVGHAVNGHIAFHIGLAGLVGHEAVPVAQLREVEMDFVDNAYGEELVAFGLGEGCDSC